MKVAPKAFHEIIAQLKAANLFSFKESKDVNSFYFLNPDGYKLELHIGSWQERIAEKKINPWEGAEFFI